VLPVGNRQYAQLYTTVSFYGAAWCGMVRHGAAWCGMVRHGAALIAEPPGE